MDFEERGRTLIGFIWLRVRRSGGCCEHGDEHSGYVNCGEFLDKLRIF
jgi:hypothetical protein